MMEGVLRHCTHTTIDRQYTDSHGQSLPGVAFAHLLGFKLLPRTKRIAHQKLVKADADDQVPSCLTGMAADKPSTGRSSPSSTIRWSSTPLPRGWGRPRRAGAEPLHPRRP